MMFDLCVSSGMSLGDEVGPRIPLLRHASIVCFRELACTPDVT
jgi:hypothetical protein